MAAGPRVTGMTLVKADFAPIDHVPAKLKDGRPVLGFNANAFAPYKYFVMHYDRALEGWYSLPASLHRKPTGWIEIDEAQ